MFLSYVLVVMVYLVHAIVDLFMFFVCHVLIIPVMFHSYVVVVVSFSINTHYCNCMFQLLISFVKGNASSYILLELLPVTSLSCY